MNKGLRFLIWMSVYGFLAACGGENTVLLPPSEETASGDAQDTSMPIEGVVQEIYMPGSKAPSKENVDDWYAHIKSSSSVTPYWEKSSSSFQNSKDSTGTVASSSSEGNSVLEPGGFMPNPDIKYGTLVDSRDSMVYRTVEIGKQVWMAENLKLSYEYGTSHGLCYDRDVKNCQYYGRLYNWSAAMDSAGVSGIRTEGCGYGNVCGNRGVVNGVCPDGWALPTTNDWMALAVAVGNAATAGVFLKSFAEWNGTGMGSDSYGFSAYPGGFFGFSGFEGFGSVAKFWTSSEVNSSSAYIVTLKSASAGLDISLTSKGVLASVRCVKSNNVDKRLYDSRDGSSYEVTKIGNQTWMAENLKIDYPVSGSTSCYLDKTENCDKYGRYYRWSAIMDSAGLYSTQSVKCGDREFCWMEESPRGICPEGWHVPGANEWKILVENAGGASSAGLNLKSKEGWVLDGNGLDKYGFSAFPLGSWHSDSTYESFGHFAIFWTTEEYNPLYVLSKNMYFGDNNVEDVNVMKSTGLPVRCIRNH